MLVPNANRHFNNRLRFSTSPGRASRVATEAN